jgi:hypothetical protein
MSMATHCIAEDICVKFRPKCTDDTGDYQECCGVAPDCSPASGEGRIAPGFFTEYWAKMNATWYMTPASTHTPDRSPFSGWCSNSL